MAYCASLFWMENQQRVRRMNWQSLKANEEDPTVFYEAASFSCNLPEMFVMKLYAYCKKSSQKSVL